MTSLSIVQLNVTQTIAAAPPVFQGMGGIVSQGGTTITPGTGPGSGTILTQASDLTPLLVTPLAIASISWAGSIATVTTEAPHGYTDALVIPVTITGAAPTGYNGNFEATITGASTFTYPLASNPGSETVPGTYVPQSAAELLASVTSYFAQGGNNAVYVFEEGAGSSANGISYLTTWLTNNAGVYYAFIVPDSWADDETYATLLAAYEAPTSKLYFFTTMTLDNYTSFTNLQKCVVGLVESSTAPATEKTIASLFNIWISTRPSTTNRVAPFSYRYMYGVTPWSTAGNGPTFTALAAAGVNWAGTGAEGGISDAIDLFGTTMDVQSMNYWYAADWAQINLDQNLSNSVINGSNNPINPLYSTQAGINLLPGVAAATLAQGVTYGLLLGTVVQTQYDGPAFQAALAAGSFAGQVVINAVPFIPYSAENPDDYGVGLYSGLSAAIIPQTGFRHLVFNLNVSNFVSQ